MEEMNYRQVEGILYNYKIIKASIENNKLKLENLEWEEDIDDGVGAISYGEPSSKTNKISRTTEIIAINNIEKKDKARKELKRKIAIESNKIKMIDNALNGLCELERKVVVYYYLEEKQWWEVASDMCYSQRQCINIRNKAINNMLIIMNGGKGNYDR